MNYLAAYLHLHLISSSLFYPFITCQYINWTSVFRKPDWITLVDVGVVSVNGIEVLADRLAKLKLKNTRLRSIDSLKHLHKLFDLDLSQNQVKDITALGHLSKISMLNLEKNRISNISCLSKLNKLTELYLNENLISDISSLSGLASLTRLVLYGNDIKNTDIFSKYSFERLVLLKLDFNSIDTLQHIGKQKHLYQLDVKNNKLDSIEPLKNDVGTMCDFSFNRISSIDSLKCQRLTELRVNSNLIVQIQTLNKCLNLRRIEFRGNLIENIDVIGQLNKLTMIDFSHNRIESIPDLSKLDMLTFLDVSFNRVRSIDSRICALSKLTALLLRANDIDTLDCSNNSLNYLDSAMNRMRSIDLTGSRLYWIELGDNELDENLIKNNINYDIMLNLQLLKLNNNNRMSGFNISLALDYLPSVLELDLSNLNQMGVRNKLNLSANCNLNVLKLSNVSLEEIHFSRCQSYFLSNLNLSSNKLTSIGNLDHLVKLASIDLTNIGSTSLIESISFDRFAYLQHISISYYHNLFHKIKILDLEERLEKKKKFSLYKYFRPVYLNTPDYFECDLTLKFLRKGVLFNLKTNEEFDFYVLNCQIDA